MIDPAHKNSNFRALPMSSLDAADIEKIAWLARLSVDRDGIREYTRELSSILKLVEQMNSMDTTGVDPMAHPLELNSRMRPDQVTETDQRERFQACAPAVEEGLYLVPKVIE
jgi:aspartyl-tRNA(Asn)/glutamyl-tRNA(Gln) amidotransferase subunit C